MHHTLLYIDPGTGSYLAQVIAAAVLGISFFFRNIRNFFKSLFTRKKHNDNPPA